MRNKALVLLSGGLDSTLALRVMLELGFEVLALNFNSPFCRCNSRNGCGHEASRVAGEWGIRCRVIAMGQEYLDMVRNPAHGYGKNLNPCIDCRIMMLRKAKEIMEEEGASFLVTGEVLGQRPMSQRRDSMHLIERESGLKGLILRPLSAKLLRPTVPEREGLVDRERLLDLSGRSRKPQIELAENLGVKDYPCPAGGCQLTNPQFARRLKDHFEHSPETTVRDVKLLGLGRHLRLTPGAKAIVGRNEEENRRLLALAGPEEYLLQVRSGKGPLTILQGEAEEATADGSSPLRLAAGITLRYSSASGRKEREVRVRRGPSGEERVIASMPLPEEEIALLRIG